MVFPAGNFWHQIISHRLSSDRQLEFFRFRPNFKVGPLGDSVYSGARIGISVGELVPFDANFERPNAGGSHGVESVEAQPELGTRKKNKTEKNQYKTADSFPLHRRE